MKIMSKMYLKQCDTKVQIFGASKFSLHCLRGGGWGGGEDLCIVLQVRIRNPAFFVSFDSLNTYHVRLYTNSTEPCARCKTMPRKMNSIRRLLLPGSLVFGRPWSKIATVWTSGLRIMENRAESSLNSHRYRYKAR